MNLWDSVQFLPGVGPKAAQCLGSCGIQTIFDLIGTLPIGYLDYPPKDPQDIEDNIPASTAIKILQNNRIKGHKTQRVLCQLEPWPLGPKKNSNDSQKSALGALNHLIYGELLFFTQSPLLRNPAFQPGQTLILRGSWKKTPSYAQLQTTLDKKISYQMVHPKDFLPSYQWHRWSSHEVIYGGHANLSSQKIAQWIQTALQKVHKTYEWLPSTFLQKQCWPSFLEAIKKCHDITCPQDLDPTNPERCRLAFDELFAQQWVLLWSQNQRKRISASPLPGNPLWTETLLKNFGFPMTLGQKNIFEEIQKDLQSTQPMMRLVHGDVGSGKTLLGFLALFHGVASGKQGVFLAPTEILAQQHKKTLDHLCQDLPIRTVLLTRTSLKKKEIYKGIANRQYDIIIGTHALLEENVIFQDLGLVVIDEQQRFGVQQRLALVQKSPLQSNQPSNDSTNPIQETKNHPLRPQQPDHQPKDTKQPATTQSLHTSNIGLHLLLLSATPIPRTMALCLWGDLDVSLLQEKPGKRPPIQTVILPNTRLAELQERIAIQLEKDQRVYWVCPAVGENSLDLVAAEQRYKELSQCFPHKVALLHGKLSKDEKSAALKDFYNGTKPLLVSTTVIEVGIHVPEANIMVIEQSQRFGLSQLHQLRGRVGRGDDPSYCFFLYDLPLSAQGRERLQVLKEHNDGFVIAHFDWKMRGGGERMGSKQSGMPSYRFFEWEFHQHLIPQARDMVKDLQKSLTSCPSYTPQKAPAQPSPCPTSGIADCPSLFKKTSGPPDPSSALFPCQIESIKVLLRFFQKEFAWENVLAG
jgi:ATP-dependent DNA helicase RecG